MSRYSAAWKTAGAGSTTLPMASLYATAAVRPRIKEIGVFNTTATAFDVALRRATTAGTVGTGREELYMNDNSQAAVSTAFEAHSVAPTMTAGNIRVASLGAAIGSGVIWTFGGDGLIIPNTTGDGIVIIGLTTPQICTVYFEWEE